MSNSDHDTITQQALTLANGNPGAAAAMGDLLSANPAEEQALLTCLEEMNMHGPRIWIGYKDYCEYDETEFADCILSADEEMVTFINLRTPDDAPDVIPHNDAK